MMCIISALGEENGCNESLCAMAVAIQGQASQGIM